jgi:hypothetical protein
MFFLIKFTISFVVSFVILSIPVKNTTLFEVVHEATGPFTQEFVSIVKRNTTKAVRETGEVGIKAFSNTKPTETIRDQIQSTKSSITRSLENAPTIHDDYTDEEREMLKRIFESTQ